jgi:hypothetical protein
VSGDFRLSHVRHVIPLVFDTLMARIAVTTVAVHICFCAHRASYLSRLKNWLHSHEDLHGSLAPIAIRAKRRAIVGVLPFALAVNLMIAVRTLLIKPSHFATPF